MKYLPYPKYKDSGVEWLGEVPEHWISMRFKNTLSMPLQYGANESAEYDDPTWPRYIRITDVTEDGKLRDETFKSLPEEVAKPFLLQDEDLLFARSGATVGKTFIYSESWGRAAYAGYLIRARLRKQSVAPRFIYHYCRSRQYWDWLSGSFIQATIQNVSAEKYANLEVTLPPLTEQLTIASFLDRETARIDKLIEKKQRQIELLREKRAALISHAATKGLDPNVKMKDSGIEWLGEVPEHWELLPLRRVIHRFIDYRGKTPIKTESGIPLITAGAIKDGVIDHSLVPEYIAEDDYDEWMTRGLPEIGDVLLTTEAPLGEVALINEAEIALAQRIILLKVDPTYMKSTFLRYYYLSDEGRSELLSRASGSTASGIRSDRLRMSLVVVPPIEDQVAITEFLDEEFAALMRPLALIEASVERLFEYHTALISAAVTGKINVTGGFD